MSDLFYSHLVPIEDSLAQLDQLTVTDEERATLENMIVTMYHQTILETIMREIDAEHHDRIVEMIAKNPYDLGIMIEIKSHNPAVEEAIIDSGTALSSHLQGLLIARSSQK